MRTLKQMLNMIFNHEIWVVCKHCGREFDYRKSDYCESCGKRN